MNNTVIYGYSTKLHATEFIIGSEIYMEATVFVRKHLYMTYKMAYLVGSEKSMESI